jgi:replication factor A1
MAQLSAGVCLKLLQNGDTNQDLLEQEHIVQVLSVKSVSPDRFRVIFSDGIYYAQSMLATQMNHLATEKSIDKHTIIALEKLSFNIVQGRRSVVSQRAHTLGRS